MSCALCMICSGLVLLAVFWLVAQAVNHVATLCIVQLPFFESLSVVQALLSPYYKKPEWYLSHGYPLELVLKHAKQTVLIPSNLQ